ncbi:hypothetical protein LCM10_02245 [Rossellomorea aquimaris]|uniref:hypothetical protein n=1 Tax=Rossellomorea aquimaris TaxID=189382 RepID=UPI001CD63CEA|nr:hypothetical protein [Rossellomorea aquimaris]MCA1053792.1 hypothetical protein [Rossellomorea aquimaris]
MPHKLAGMIVEMILIIAGIIFVSATSLLFENQTFSFTAYLNGIVEVFLDLFSPGELVYVNPISGVERSLFPILLLAFWSSARIFFLSLTIAILASIILLIMYFIIHKRLKPILNICSFLFGSLPDLFVIIVVQLVIVLIFKETGILLIDIASFGENQVIILPAIILSILPAFFFFSNMVQFLKEEEGKAYVELAMSKGLGRFTVLFFHMVRNVLISLTYHGKQIAWMMISNLLILEYLFNVFGVTSFLFTYNTPSVFAVASILLFLPLYLLIKLLQYGISKVTGKEMSL